MTTPPNTWWILLGDYSHAQRWLSTHPDVPRDRVVHVCRPGDETRIRGIEGHIEVVELPRWRRHFRGQDDARLLDLIATRQRPR